MPRLGITPLAPFSTNAGSGMWASPASWRLNTGTGTTGSMLPSGLTSSSVPLRIACSRIGIVTGFCLVRRG
ncbi:MAG: hypothetical protein R3D29_13370 [Nitratireductor sp.]